MCTGRCQCCGQRGAQNAALWGSTYASALWTAQSCLMLAVHGCLPACALAAMVSNMATVTRPFVAGMGPLSQHCAYSDRCLSQNWARYQQPQNVALLLQKRSSISSLQKERRRQSACVTNGKALLRSPNLSSFRPSEIWWLAVRRCAGNMSIECLCDCRELASPHLTPAMHEGRKATSLHAGS